MELRSIVGSGIYVETISPKETLKINLLKDKINRPPDQEAKKAINLINMAAPYKKRILTMKLIGVLNAWARIIVSTPREDIGGLMNIVKKKKSSLQK